jgi:tetratricopeptide (TPR) repeat protein
MGGVKIFSSKRSSLLVLLIIAAFLFILAINSNAPMFRFNTHGMGSFEYIREGDSFLDKGIYDKAITCYEKAYKSSPDNNTIRSSLVFAYSKYASALADLSRFDDAIGYLTKAYDVKRDPSTNQNLAIMYTRKAVPFAQKGDSGKFSDLIREARRIASAYNASARNLGISLSNDGVKEFKKGREDIALLCLKESLRAYGDGRTSALLGDVYYKVGELKEAKAYWHRAKTLNADDPSLASKLKRVKKEIALAPAEKEIDLPHFEVRYKETLPIDAGFAASILERVYLDVGKDLAYFPKTKTGVFFYSKSDFKNIFKMPAMVRAFYDGNIRMPAPDARLTSEEFSRHVYHEYTHALLSAKTLNNCPVWFGEGISMWEELTKSGYDLKDLPLSAEMADDITLESLDKEFDKNEIGANRAAYYVLSYTVAAYIIKGWGVTSLQKILERLAQGQHVINAIDDEFLLSEKEFERRWKAYIKDNYLFKN